MVKKTLLIGVGRMGGAILSNPLKQKNSADEYYVVDRSFKVKQNSFVDDCTMHNYLAERIDSGINPLVNIH